MTTYLITPEERRLIENNFTYHSPNPDQVMTYQFIREQAKHLAELLYSHCPPSRERSLALTNLEQTVFWANAAIARNE